MGKKRQREEWRECADLLDHEVSSLGRVRSSFSEAEVMYTKNRAGYLAFKGFPIHHLVVTAFLGDVPDGFERHHRDGNKLNNRASNLKILSKKEHAHQISYSSQLLQKPKKGLPDMIESARKRGYDLKEVAEALGVSEAMLTSSGMKTLSEEGVFDLALKLFKLLARFDKRYWRRWMAKKGKSSSDMKEKYEVRQAQGTKRTEEDLILRGVVVLGLWYEKGEVVGDFENKKPNPPGLVIVGGRRRFQPEVLELLDLFTVDGTGKMSEDDIRVITKPTSKGKARWVLKDVPIRRWKRGLDRMEEAGFDCSKTRSFGRLCW